MSRPSERIKNLSAKEFEQFIRQLGEKKGNASQNSIGLRPRESNICAPSFAQQRLWFLEQLMPNNPSYNVPAAIRLEGRLDVAALQRSFNEIVRRHEVLRTTFAVVEGLPVQVISEALSLSLPVVNLMELLERRERETQAQQLAGEDAQAPFDLACGPLVRMALLRLGEEEHILLLNMHHIVSDGWSNGVLVRELSTLYAAYVANRPSPLPELPIQYADFAFWQRQWLQGKELEKQLAYWRRQLAGIPVILELPTDRQRPAIQTFHGAVQPLAFPQELTKGLKTLSRRTGVTLLMTLLAAFQALLFRYTGKEDIVVGMPIANRTRTESENLIGFFVNTLAMRTNFSGDPSFRELLARVREMTLEAYAHQNLPFERLVEDLQPERELSHPPLFQIAFTLQNAPQEKLSLVDLTLSPLEVENRTAKLDLALFMWEKGNELHGGAEYNTDLFDASTIKRLLEHFQNLLEGIVADPEQRLTRLPLLTESEHLQLKAWNATQVEYPQHRCIQELFEAVVEDTPDAVAIVCGDEQLTYSTLNRQANRLAHYLRRQGVGPEIPVGLCVERSTKMIIGLLSVLKANGAYVPLDPTYPKERLGFILADTRISVLLTERRLLEKLPDSTSACVICLDSDWEEIAGESVVNQVNRATVDNLMYVIYTSGSTSKPKGVLLSHRGVCNFIGVQVKAFGVQRGNRLLQFASLSFDGSIFDIFAALLSGATLCLSTQETLLPGPALHLFLRNQAITTAALPPSVLVQLPTTGLSALQTVISVGEACPTEVIARWSAGRRFINGYGPTEGTVAATIAAYSDTGQKPLIGRPITNTQVYVLDARMQPTPIGVAGELYITGVGLARGYLNRSELTAERFIPDPFSSEPGTRMYRTGDLGRYLADGNLELLGRLDSQVKLRGYRIELGEIEAALMEYPAIREAIVIVREDAPGDKRLVAYLVARSPQTASITDLNNYLRAKLPGYMVPSAFVLVDAWPLTSNGKIDRRALPKPDKLSLPSEAAYMAPRNQLEQAIAAAWHEVLQIENIGVHDNFFDVGGHSLLITRLQSHLQTIFQRDIPILSLFQYPTISSLGDYLSQEQGEQSSFQSSRTRGENRRVLVQQNQSYNQQLRSQTKPRRRSEEPYGTLYE